LHKLRELQAADIAQAINEPAGLPSANHQFPAEYPENNL
jgi:hypothetical protein